MCKETTDLNPFEQVRRLISSVAPLRGHRQVPLNDGTWFHVRDKYGDTIAWVKRADIAYGLTKHFPDATMTPTIIRSEID